MKQLVTIPWTHTIPEHEATLRVPAQTISGEVSKEIEVGDGGGFGAVPGPLAGPFVARLLGNVAELPLAGDVTDRLRALLQTGKMILLNDGTADLSETIQMPSGTRIEGSGDTRNHTSPPTGSVFRSKVTGSHTVAGRSFLKPALSTNHDLSAGGIILSGFGIVGDNLVNPLLRLYGIGNGSKIGPLRLKGGGDQLEFFDAATDHSAAYYGVGDTIFADGMGGKFCVIDAGAVKGGRGPIYAALHHCDVQGTRGADIVVRNGQGRTSDHTTAGNVVVRDSVFHGGPPVHIDFVNCEEMRLRHDAVITTSPVVIQSNKASLRGLITANQFGAQQKTGWLVKKPGTQIPITAAMQGFIANAEIEV